MRQKIYLHCKICKRILKVFKLSLGKVNMECENCGDFPLIIKEGK